MKYKHNNWQKASFVLWGIGGLFCLIPIAVMATQDVHSISVTPLVVMLVLAVFSLATGNTCYKVGSSREQE